MGHETLSAHIVCDNKLVKMSITSNSMMERIGVLGMLLTI
jgi:hypothetical protein